MAIKLTQRCTSALSVCMIIVLLAVVIFVWLQFSYNSYSRQHYQKFNITTFITTTEKGFEIHREQFRAKEYDERPVDEDDNIEFVKPVKISPSKLTQSDILFDKLSNNYGQPTIRHHSGHFRHKTAEVWDPHPNYEINAFGKKIILQLELDNNFIAPNLQILTHVRDNYIERVIHDPKMARCFYTGKVLGDSDSSASVSLCNGMTGHFRTSESTYEIKPDKASNNTFHTFWHKLKRIPHPSPKEITVTTTNNNNKINDSHIVDDEYSSHIINKRSANSFISLRNRRSFINPSRIYVKRNNEYFIKLLMVADQTMVQYHKNDEDLRQYILTVMSHVALLFKHASIGNAVNIAVVNILILKHGNFSNTNSQDTLRQFCEWQRANTEIAHDAALLLTRDSICKNTSADMCNTLGVAEVGSMCTSSGCAIVRDKGLSSSYTIAHEIGHLLGMPHDTDKTCHEFSTGEDYNNIMSKMMQNDTKPWMWSECSKYILSEFLETNRAKCLLLSPTEDYFLRSSYVHELPGEIFKVDRQCELEFGNGSKICSYMPECGSLWCTTKFGEQEGCKTQFLPWAEGTPCKNKGWCHHGKCIHSDRFEFTPINGGWGPWDKWTPCSRTCGGGVKLSKRHCDSPKPENGGAYCAGKNIRYSSCNVMDCDPDQVDFRMIQCAEFNGITKNLPNLTSDVEWLPKYGLDQQDDVCRLYCRPKNSLAYYMLKNKVIDGTKCGLSSYDICVNGICRQGGCDNKLESKMMLDDCGICGGDNSKCHEITGKYNMSILGYNRVVRIPRGSSNLDIRQHARDDSGKDANYLVLVDGETGEYILNGNYMAVTLETDVIFGSLIIKYSGSYSHIENITTPKNHKLTKDLIVEVLCVGNVTPPDITYRYVISQDIAPKYGWRVYNNQQWTECNSICSGHRFLRPFCVELSSGIKVSDTLCDHLDIHSVMQKQECNSHCQLTWNVDSKHACSEHCGKGVRQVFYNCMRVHISNPNLSDVVDEKHCAILPKPPSMESCYTECKETRWNYSTWSECSKTCGGGVQKRTASCIDFGVIVDDSFCNEKEKLVMQVCNRDECPVWSFEESPCSESCGIGYRNITQHCHRGNRIVDPMFCDQNEKRPNQEPCNEMPCFKWDDEPWSQCSVSCGSGIRTKKYVCKIKDSNQMVDDGNCRHLIKPMNTEIACKMLSCEYFNPYSYNDINDNSISSYGRQITFQWVPGEWTPCSRTCDEGISQQIFHCRNELGQENEAYCNENRKPNNVVKCQNNPCPKWKTSNWAETCDENCETSRQVYCFDHNIQDESKCNSTEKPVTTTKCPLDKCIHATISIPSKYFDSNRKQNRYKWKIGKWAPCSNKCGKGTRTRQIFCEDSLNEIIVVDSLCNHLPKSRATKPCERYKCKFAWIENYWSSCSASCGPGIRTRNVTCHSVHQGVVDPKPLPKKYLIRSNRMSYCPMLKKPLSKETCMVSRCSDKYVWQTSEWKPCSHACGRSGKQTRRLYCVDVITKHRVRNSYCPEDLRPVKHQHCNRMRCLNKSCKDIQINQRTKQNRDYSITIKGKKAQVYCYKMDTSDPEEYISLYEDSANYAEFYDKRLLQTETCWYNGERHENCPCLDVDSDRSGLTLFWKVRLNVTSLKIIEDDYTFSRQSKGRRIPYGTAGDCYSSMYGCAQGQFSIDLSQTSFKLSSKVNWTPFGNNASADISISEFKAGGRCGGYCGNCFPDPKVGLQLEVLHKRRRNRIS